MGGVLGPQLSKADIFSLGLSIYEVARLQRYLRCSHLFTQWIDLWTIVFVPSMRNWHAGCQWILMMELISHQSGRVGCPPLQATPRSWWFSCAPSLKRNLAADPQLTGCCFFCQFPCNTDHHLGCSRILHWTHQQSSPCLSWRGNSGRRGRRYCKIWVPLFIMFSNCTVPK